MNRFGGNARLGIETSRAGGITAGTCRFIRGQRAYCCSSYPVALARHMSMNIAMPTMAITIIIRNT